ncbi:hypothetical protein EDD93_3656 [Streptomyces sp. 840.1]|uniref:hypothetical protein n=1 Tax=Streptomyces sp. 840.1 TaxID=2485152 RepID=UPI000F47B69A|nr:hypothetical protein [Streptomyces sp. 840.1]ROQ69159.1 hypothetical protein EDD93_3656 [Streptomyces sp. 840.1]
MTTDIFEGMTGRGLISYDLCDEAMETYGLTQREAHEAISAFVQGLADDDSAIILDRQPTRPELLVNNPGDVDVDYWVTVSDETADHIRGALAASFEPVA